MTTGDQVTGEERMLVDGKLRPARSGRTFEVVNPATEEVIGVVADAGAEDLDDAVTAARRAFDETDWSTNVELRVRGLRQLQAAFTAHADELRAMTVAETGSPVSFTYSAQLDAPVEGLGWVATLAEGYQWETDLGDAAPMGIPSHRWVRREATGVVGAITPWNVPHQINLAKLGPALAAGNTVVLKPAPDTRGAPPRWDGWWPRRPTSRRAWSTSSPPPSTPWGRCCPATRGSTRSASRDRRPPGSRSWSRRPTR